jgi:dihydrofolate reductase
MGKVFIHVTMSLDGFIARPDGSVDWGFNFGTDELVVNIVKEIGAIVCGNRGYWERQVYFSEDSLPYGGMVRAPVFVVTHLPRQPLVIGGLTFNFVGGIQPAIEMAQAAAGGKSVALLGASIDQQCLQQGLVDELVIHLAPILLGEGVRLFEHFGSQPLKLERLEVVATAGITSLHFRVVK